MKQPYGLYRYEGTQKLINYDGPTTARLSTGNGSWKILGAIARFDIWSPQFFKNIPSSLQIDGRTS